MSTKQKEQTEKKRNKKNQLNGIIRDTIRIVEYLINPSNYDKYSCECKDTMIKKEIEKERNSSNRFRIRHYQGSMLIDSTFQDTISFSYDVVCNNPNEDWKRLHSETSKTLKSGKKRKKTDDNESEVYLRTLEKEERKTNSDMKKVDLETLKELNLLDKDDELNPNRVKFANVFEFLRNTKLWTAIEKSGELKQMLLDVNTTPLCNGPKQKAKWIHDTMKCRAIVLLQKFLKKYDFVLKKRYLMDSFKNKY